MAAPFSSTRATTASTCSVMDAALRLGCHYCDLGGLFHVTRQQLRRHAEFKRAGLLALCGIGSAPGIVNVMARDSADRFERVREIHVAVATSDRTPRRGDGLLETSVFDPDRAR